MGKIKHDAKLRIGWILFIPLLASYLLTEAILKLPTVPERVRSVFNFLTDKIAEYIFPDFMYGQVTVIRDPDMLLTLGRWRRELAAVLQQCGEVVVEGVCLATSFSCF